jgi:ABC-2 type transport system permease protein
MKHVLAMALKDLRLLARDRMAMFFIVVFPMAMGIFFGVISGGFDDDDGGGKMTVGVVDEDRSLMSDRFIKGLAAQKGVQVNSIGLEAARDEVRRGRMTGYLRIPQGFGETAGIMWSEGPAIEVGMDPSRKAEGAMVEGLIMQSMGQLVQSRFSNPEEMRGQIGKSLSDVEQSSELSSGQKVVLRGLLATVDQFLGSMGPQIKALNEEGSGAGPNMELARIERVDVTARKGRFHEVVSKLRSPWDISFPSAMLWGVIGCIAGFAVSIVKEKTDGTLLRLTVAPISRGQVLAGKAVACFFTAIGVIVFMTILGIILGMRPGNYAFLALATLCTSLCFVGLMMLISVLGKTEQAVGGAGWAILLVCAMFGGGMVPLAFMPSFMQTLSSFSPVKWGILAIEGAVWRQFTLAEMAFPCGVLLSIGAAAFAVGVTILSRRTT